MLDKLFGNHGKSENASAEDRSHGRRRLEGGAIDLRSKDPAAGRDRSAHRRSAWFYEDLLN